MATSKAIIALPNEITVRPYQPSDDASITEHANNRKIWLNLTDRFPLPYKLSDAQWWISYTSDKQNWFPTISTSDRLSDEPEESFKARQAASLIPNSYAICHKDQAVGSCGLEFDPKHPRAVALGYWIGECYWGKGIMTQVAKAFAKWVFETFPWIARIEADAYSWNVGSQKVLRKVGFEFEGVQKLKAFKDGKFGDIVLFGMARPGFAPELMKAKGP